jgi:PadR family transcriptional regulator, regulatory protein PadR
MGRSSATYVAFYCTPCQVEFYIGYNPIMAPEPKLSHTAAMILQSIHCGCVYGYSLMEATGLPSGTVYPALRRLEQEGLVHSQWERQSIADAGQRPPRKYYKLTPYGKATLQSSHKRYPLLAKLVPSQEVERA